MKTKICKKNDDTDEAARGTLPLFICSFKTRYNAIVILLTYQCAAYGAEHQGIAEKGIKRENILA